MALQGSFELCQEKRIKKSHCYLWCAFQQIDDIANRLTPKIPAFVLL